MHKFRVCDAIDFHVPREHQSRSGSWLPRKRTMRLQNLIKRLRFCAAAFVEDVKVGDGEAFKDEKDLRSFLRWILRGAPGHKPTAPKA